MNELNIDKETTDLYGLIKAIGWDCELVETNSGPTVCINYNGADISCWFEYSENDRQLGLNGWVKLLATIDMSDDCDDDDIISVCNDMNVKHSTFNHCYDPDDSSKAICVYYEGIVDQNPDIFAYFWINLIRAEIDFINNEYLL